MYIKAPMRMLNALRIISFLSFVFIKFDTNKNPTLAGNSKSRFVMKECHCESDTSQLNPSAFFDTPSIVNFACNSCVVKEKLTNQYDSNAHPPSDNQFSYLFNKK